MVDPVELVQKLFAANNARDANAVRALIADNYRNQRASRVLEGADAYIANLEKEWATRPDAVTEVHRAIATEDGAVVEASWNLTSSEPLPLPDGGVLQPTGKQGVLKFLALFEAEGGVLTSDVMYYDNVAFWRSLGHTVTVE
jgi:ketosteroid isomerase-like protein